MSKSPVILVVEDSAVQAAVIGRLLSGSGYQVEVARDGQEALDSLLAARELPALVLSDIEMPGLDGYQLCRAIKANPRLERVPVILLTNLGDPQNVIFGLQAGADNYLTKPVERSLLLTRIQSLLESPALFNDGGPTTPLNFSLAGQRFAITASRGQILNLLLSTFEGAVWQNQKLRASHEEVSLANREVAEKNEQLKASMEQQNRFLGMVTHDMRNPLGVILGYSRILADGIGGPLSPKQEKFCKAIFRSTESLLTLVNDLLEISEIEAGNLRLEKTPIRLEELLGQAIEMNGFLAEPKLIRLEAQLEPIPSVTVDPNKIEQVINNLLSNAIKFSHPHSQVRVELCRDGDQVRFSVIDYGQGIPEEEQAGLFQAYQRTSVRSTAGEKSTGLGLAIVKRIVEGHGGTITLESQVGKGSSFHVRLPLDDAGSQQVS